MVIGGSLALPTPVNIAALNPWQIYGESASWPIVAGHQFIIDVAARIMAVKFGLRPEDAADHDSSGYRNEVANRLTEFLMKGSLIASARALEGGPLLPVADAEWTCDLAFAAVSTGIVPRRRGKARRHPHHVFVGGKEAELLAQVYGATDLLHQPEEAGPTESLGGIVLDSLSVIARNRAALAPRGSAEAVVELLLPGSNFTLSPNDRDKLIAAAVPWLVKRFERDPDHLRRREHFEEEALKAFSPYMTGRVFEKVWAKAAARPMSPAEPRTSTHQERSRGGRRSERRAPGKDAD